MLARIMPSVSWEAVNGATIFIMAISKAATCKDEEEMWLEGHT